MVDRLSWSVLAVLFLAGASIVFGVLWFLQTRDVLGTLGLIVGVPALLGTLAALAWVARDADELGLPKGPWIAALLLAPGLGLVGYLIAREVARRETETVG